MIETKCRPSSQQTKATEEPLRRIIGPKPAWILEEVLVSPPVTYESLKQRCTAVGIKNVKSTVRKLSTDGLLETEKTGKGRFIDLTPDGYWTAFRMGLLDNYADGANSQPIELPDHLQHQPKEVKKGTFEVAHGGKIKPKQDHGSRGNEGTTERRHERYSYPQNTVRSIRMKHNANLAKIKIEDGLFEAYISEEDFNEQPDNTSVDLIEVFKHPADSRPLTIADLDGKIEQFRTPEKALLF